MSSLSMVEAKLPAGFRFHPRDDELICDYLMKWVSTGGGGGGAAAGHRRPPLLIEVDLNKCEPWDIPENACVGGKDWYFYTQRDRKYATGLRTNRATISGYWKATGKDREVLRKGTLVGMRKTLVFYEGRAPKGRKTSWIMYEFRLEGPLAPPKFISPVMVDWVLCKVFNKNRSEVCAREELGSNLVEPYIDEQVSCFSIFTPNPNFSNLTHMDQDLSMSTFPHQLGDKNLVTDVLKFVYARDTSLGEGSAESYLSEVGLQQPPMWNYY